MSFLAELEKDIIDLISLSNLIGQFEEKVLRVDKNSKLVLEWNIRINQYKEKVSTICAKHGISNPYAELWKRPEENESPQRM